MFFLNVFKNWDPAYETREKRAKPHNPDFELDHHLIIAITVKFIIFTRKRMKSWLKWLELSRARIPISKLTNYINIDNEKE